MIDFKAIRAAVPTIQAAKDYGLEVNRHGMARCPFHDDHNPSLKLDDRFHCCECQRKFEPCAHQYLSHL